MYCIIRANGAYYHNKGKIILFESQQEAEKFINMFIQYSTQTLFRINPMDAVGASMVIMNESKIIPVDFNIDTIECGVVYAKELMERL